MWAKLPEIKLDDDDDDDYGAVVCFIMDPSQIDKLIRRSPGSLLSTAIPQATYSNKNRTTLSSYTSFNTLFPSPFWLVAVLTIPRM